MDEHPDTPHPSGRDKYAVYIVGYRSGKLLRRRLCETSREGIGLALETMIEEDEIERGDSIGIFNRETRTWLINPYLVIR